MFSNVPTIYWKTRFYTMKKERYLEDLKDIKNMSNKIRRMNESVMFEDEYDDVSAEEKSDIDDIPEYSGTDEDEIETGIEGTEDLKDTKPEDKGMEELDEMGELDKIRKITLEGMLKFSNQPEHPQFQALQRIFQMCNKAIDTKENMQGA